MCLPGCLYVWCSISFWIDHNWLAKLRELSQWFAPLRFLCFTHFTLPLARAFFLSPFFYIHLCRIIFFFFVNRLMNQVNLQWNNRNANGKNPWHLLFACAHFDWICLQQIFVWPSDIHPLPLPDRTVRFDVKWEKKKEKKRKWIKELLE